MLVTKFAAVLVGLVGASLFLIGLSALGLTMSPRPSSFPADIYAHLKQLEWAIAIIFVPLGMGIIRLAMVRLGKPAEKPEATEPDTDELETPGVSHYKKHDVPRADPTPK